MYFVTGASGLVGKTLVKSLVHQGHQVKVFHREKSELSYLEELKDSVIKIEGSLFDVPLLIDELRDVETVIHTAALVSFKKSDEKELYHVNVEGTANLVNACLIANVKKFLHVSSIAAIGRNTKQTNINEEHKWIESSVNSKYAKSKYLGELEVWRGFEEGLNGFIINPSIILGKGDWSKSSSQIFKFIYENQKHYPEAYLNFVDLRDVRDVILKLLSAEVTHQRYIVSGGQISYQSFFEEVSSRIGVDSVRKPLSLRKMKWLLFIDVIRVFLTGKASLITRETINSFKYKFNYSSSKVLNSIDHEFRNIEELLNDVIPYYIKKYKL